MVKLDAPALAVDGLVAILAVSLVKGVEPEEERRALDAVELDEVADEVAVDDRALDAAQEVLLEHLLGLLGMAHVADVLLVHRVEVAALYPALCEAGLDHLLLDDLVGVDHEALGIGDVAAYQDACHALAGTILDAIARVDDQRAGVLLLLEDLDGALLAAHVEYDVFVDFSGHELFLAVDLDLAAALAQVLGGDVEDGGVVAYVVGRIGSGSHDAGNFYLSHD